VYSALQRAHKAVDERLPEQSQQAALRSLGDERLAEIVDGYVDAWERGDVDAVVGMLAEDARMTMPPLPTWYSGRAAVAAFLRRWPLGGRRRWRLIPTRANGQLAFGHYLWDEDKESFALHGVSALTLRAERIQEITSFLTDDIFRRFGLPDEIPAMSTSATACRPTSTLQPAGTRRAPLPVC
jgi:RNA polymerase sigma-70 factor (ECF subfamily)